MSPRKSWQESIKSHGWRENCPHCSTQEMKSSDLETRLFSEQAEPTCLMQWGKPSRTTRSRSTRTRSLLGKLHLPLTTWYSIYPQLMWGVLFLTRVNPWKAAGLQAAGWHTLSCAQRMCRPTCWCPHGYLQYVSEPADCPCRFQIHHHHPSGKEIISAVPAWLPTNCTEFNRHEMLQSAGNGTCKIGFPASLDPLPFA